MLKLVKRSQSLETFLCFFFNVNFREMKKVKKKLVRSCQVNNNLILKRV